MRTAVAAGKHFTASFEAIRQQYRRALDSERCLLLLASAAIRYTARVIPTNTEGLSSCTRILFVTNNNVSKVVIIL
jgi:hypothetical protein